MNKSYRTDVEGVIHIRNESDVTRSLCGKSLWDGLGSSPPDPSKGPETCSSCTSKSWEQSFSATDPCLIGRVRDPWGWMGNMAPYAVDYQGLSYSSTEALFQCLRLVPGPRDESLSQSQTIEDLAKQRAEVWEDIRCERNPFKGKLIAKKHAHLRTIPCLGEQDLANLRMILRLKVKTHPLLKKWLLQTEDRILIEDCTRRQRGTGLFWGAALREDGRWWGLNWLGVLWTELRIEFQREALIFDNIVGLHEY